MLFKKYPILLLFMAPVFALHAQEKCDCEKNFKWVKETFEKNDAGFAYALEKKGRKAYESHTAPYLLKVKNIRSRDNCAEVMNEWLGFFRRAHFRVIAQHNDTARTGDAAVNSANWPVLGLQEEQLRKALAQKQDPGFEGIWTTGPYTIAIQKQAQGYKGVVLTSTNEAWKPGMVKLEINSDSTGVFYMGNFSANKVSKTNKTRLVSPNTLKLSNVFLKRTFPVLPETGKHELYTKMVMSPVPFLERISPKTLYMYIPSFEGGHKPLIDSLLTASKGLLAQTENLIIDIRNNGGGNDDSYENIIPYLYTNPIRIVGLEFYSTPLNNKRMEEYLAIPGLSEQNRTEINKALTTLNNNLGKFVNLNGDRVSIQKLDTVLPFPKNVAVVINENDGSTSEQFLLAAKQSKKTKLFGTTTIGVLDISNMCFVTSPDNQFQLGYCLSKSYRIPDMAIDGKGIQPDYYLDKTIPDEDWVSHVQQVLEQL
ncbi:S41 family peptidase [Taibaiella chishuiensis]|uniref:C-terminal processing protease CtpA/Prc n=1 Tax=Taibaiella chishuiensis TaxID=1434707 RepID=A0A2P8D1F7_9BACT|nr:S41 family peptidase [Taibaiella chishuiensis]PSK91049.1 C-terminal processing protease CtpA/Prc [Taibaiella chishuiensis]